MPCFNFYNKDLYLYYSGQKSCWSSLSEKRAFQRKVCLRKLCSSQQLEQKRFSSWPLNLGSPKQQSPRQDLVYRYFLGGCDPEDPVSSWTLERVEEERGEVNVIKPLATVGNWGLICQDALKEMKDASQNCSPKRLRREVSINSHHPLRVAFISEGLYMLQNAQMGFCMRPT